MNINGTKHSREIIRDLQAAPSTVKGEIPDHASMRSQIDCVNYHLYGGRAVRSNGEKFDVDVRVGRAPLQVGQGNRENHAAHPNSISGLIDNLKEKWAEQIWKEKEVTPKKEAALKQMLTPEAMEQLKAAQLPLKEIQNIVGKGPLAQGSQWELTSNATNRFKRSVNLSCDRPLETYYRRLCPAIFKKVMWNEMSPRKATEKSVEINQNHLKRRISELEKKDDSPSKRRLCEHKQELQGTQNVPYKHVVGDFYDQNNVFIPERTNSLLARRNVKQYR